jgi:hypothetical protein
MKNTSIIFSGTLVALLTAGLQAYAAPPLTLEDTDSWNNNNNNWYNVNLSSPFGSTLFLSDGSTASTTVSTLFSTGSGTYTDAATLNPSKNTVISGNLNLWLKATTGPDTLAVVIDGHTEAASDLALGSLTVTGSSGSPGYYELSFTLDAQQIHDLQHNGGTAGTGENGGVSGGGTAGQIYYTVADCSGIFLEDSQLKVTASAPDGGSTVMLLGAVLTVLGLAKCKMS